MVLETFRVNALQTLYSQNFASFIKTYEYEQFKI